MSEEKDIRRLMIEDEEERRIIGACAKGNWEEFSYIFEKYKDRVYFLALNIVRRRALALDITQETFIKVFKSLKWFNQRSRFSTWLYRIAYNQALDEYRKAVRKDEVEFIEELDTARLRSSKGALFNDIAGKELGEKLRAAVEQLPIKLRTAVILKYVEGLTYSEICEIVGCARGVLQKRLSQSGKKLRALLKQEISELHG